MTELLSHLRQRGQLPPRKKWLAVGFLSSVVTILGLLLIYKGGAPAALGKTAALFFAPCVFAAWVQLLERPVMRRQRNEFVVKGSKWASICYFCVCGFWAVGGLHLLLIRPEVYWIALTLVALCAFGMTAALFTFFDDRPVIVIDEFGFFDRSLRIGTIPWKEVAGARIDVVQGTPVIALSVDDPEKLTKNLSWKERWLSRLDQIVGFELLHLGLVRMDASYIDEALDFVLSKARGGSTSNDVNSLVSHFSA